jgi:hypothetical protein
VAVPDFFFAIDLSGGDSNDMFRQVVSRLLVQAGCAVDAAPQIIDSLVAAIGGDPQGCRVTFAARNGKLDIEVTSAAGRLMQASHPLA